MRKIRLALAIAAMALVATAAVARASGGSPKIHAEPHSVMVNSPTILKGKGFPANTTVELQECGVTAWMAPADPCLQDGISVNTDRKGRFQTSFNVGLCPEGRRTRKPTQVVCYVGELVSGEDTASLLGSARLIVTYP